MSQNTAILQWLRQGRQITPLSALKLAGTLRLSERIRELQAAGHRIRKQMIAIAPRKRVMCYWLAR